VDIHFACLLTILVVASGFLCAADRLPTIAEERVVGA